MIYRYQCKSCLTLSESEVSTSDKPREWRPPFAIACSACEGGKAVRIWGCDVGIQNDSDAVKHIGQSNSNASNIEFVGSGFPDSDRKIQEEVDELEALMDEPPTRHDIAAANQQMEELERERGKPKGFYSGEREMESVEFQKMTDQEMEQEAARLASSLGQEVGNQDNYTEEGDRIVKVSPENLSQVAGEYGNSVYNLEGQDNIKIQRVKRRGKEALSEEAKDSKIGRL